MRRLLFPLLALLLCLSGPAMAAKLKIATLSPEGTSWMKHMRGAGKRIAKETRGRVRLRFYPGGVMGDYKAMLRKIRIGQLHGAAVTGGALAAIAPDAVIYRLPFLFRTLSEVDHLRNRLDPRIADQLANKSMHTFGFAGGGFTHLMSTREIRNLQQAQKRKVWAPVGDRVSEAAFKSLKISPITLPLTDVLTGLQTGLVDTVAAPPVVAIALQWHTQTEYLLDMPLTFSYGALVLAERALKRVSSADRAVLTRILTETFAAMDRENRQDNIEAKAALRNQGMKFLQPSPSERAHLERTVESAMHELGQGNFFTPGLVQEARDLVSDFREGRAAAAK
jgi:TRAP-type C4-dicarboxylate transport system substrate-binding protein